MSEPKRVRRRRRARTDDVPADLAAWFAGERPANYVPWEAILPGHEERLPERWRTWSGAHPGVRPPAGYEWIAEAEHFHKRARN